MIKHILRIVWNRKRANGLVALEIAISFLVLFAVVAITVYFHDNYSRPLGFSYEGVWNVNILREGKSDDTWSPESVDATRRLLLAVRELPEVESAAAVSVPPYSNSESTYGMDFKGGRKIEFHAGDATDDFKDVMQIALVSGRWFSREDNGASYSPVVINEVFARDLFGSGDAIGEVIREASEGERELRVIGVITEFRKNGEYSAPTNWAFFRASLDDPKSRPPGNLAVRLRPGTGRVFEEKLATTLQGVVKEYSFEVTPLAEMRKLRLRLYQIPVIVISLVAAFLMLMVGLGLTGVLWQNVTQRTREIGLRRAKGATVRDIHQQILGELFVITSLGLAAGSIVAIQFPLLAIIGPVGASVYAWSFLISVLVIYALTTLCGLYPSWMASRIQPAAALHYE